METKYGILLVILGYLLCLGCMWTIIIIRKSKKSKAKVKPITI